MIDEAVGDSVTNTATVSSDEDKNPENDTDISGPTPIVTDPDDPPTGELLVVQKQASRSEVELGDFVEYTISISNPESVPIDNVVAIDVLPTGFVYLQGSTRLNGTTAADPTADGARRERQQRPCGERVVWHNVQHRDRDGARDARLVHGSGDRHR
jgi:uncharacterized repeat protein (TIGR01451 family)